MIEPPENPPLSLVIVPEHMRPTVSAEIVAGAGVEERVISEPLSRPPPVIPLQVYIRPVVPAPAPVPAPVVAPVPEAPPVPVSATAVTVAPERPKRKRERFTTDPYLRDD